MALATTGSFTKSVSGADIRFESENPLPIQRDSSTVSGENRRLRSIESLVDSLATWFLSFGRPTGRTLSHKLSLCLCDGVASVVIRVAFFVGAVVGDPLNDDFRIIASRQGSFCVRPVGFRLAAMSGRAFSALPLMRIA